MEMRALVAPFFVEHKIGLSFFIRDPRNYFMHCKEVLANKKINELINQEVMFRSFFDRGFVLRLPNICRSVWKLVCSKSEINAHLVFLWRTVAGFFCTPLSLPLLRFPEALSCQLCKSWASFGWNLVYLGAILRLPLAPHGYLLDADAHDFRTGRRWCWLLTGKCRTASLKTPLKVLELLMLSADVANLLWAPKFVFGSPH